MCKLGGMAERIRSSTSSSMYVILDTYIQCCLVYALWRLSPSVVLEPRNGPEHIWTAMMAVSRLMRTVPVSHDAQHPAPGSPITNFEFLNVSEVQRTFHQPSRGVTRLSGSTMHGVPATCLTSMRCVRPRHSVVQQLTLLCDSVLSRHFESEVCKSLSQLGNLPSRCITFNLRHVCRTKQRAERHSDL